jgi:hypothetical protein
MRTELTLTRLAAAVLVTVLLTVTPGCNHTDDPKAAETVILVTDVAIAGQSVASGTDTTATIDYTTQLRGAPQSPVNFTHSVTLTSYTVGFTPPVIAPMSGAISTGYCPGDQGTCAIDIVLVPNGSKPGAGTAVIAKIEVEGHDVNDNPVNFTAQAAITFTP